MRLTGSILLTAIYLLAYTELHEVFTLPSLFQHYQEHKADNASLGIIGFLSMHYSGTGHHNEHDHHDLPFSDDHCLHAPSVNPLQIPEIFSTSFDRPAPVSVPLPGFRSDLHDSLTLFSIWQPPKV